MLIVETIGKIRRYHFVDGKGIREIGRLLRVSRNTVRKVVRSNATEHRYVRTRQPVPRLGAWVPRLEDLLEDDSKLLQRPGGDREFVEILDAVLSHGLEERCCST